MRAASSSAPRVIWAATFPAAVGDIRRVDAGHGHQPAHLAGLKRVGGDQPLDRSMAALGGVALVAGP